MKKTFAFPDFLNDIKQTRWSVIVLFALFHVGYTLFAWHFLIKWQAPERITQFTGGLIRPTLLYNMIPLFLIVVGIILWAGKLRLRDVGLMHSRLPLAFFMTSAVWMTTQLVLVIASLITTSPVAPHNSWQITGFLSVIGNFIAQLFGNALYEEVAFRGFLLPQLYLKFQNQSRERKNKHLVMAVIISQVFFALIHIPVFLYRGGNMVVSLSWAAFGGIFLALLYLKSENLFLAVGLHALMNKPTSVINPIFPPQIVIAFLMVLFILGWQVFERVQYKLNFK